jgi:hypothetical protein
MVVLVIAVGALAIAVHELADLRHAELTTRRIFTAVWTLANLIICANGLYRIRRARSQV